MCGVSQREIYSLCNVILIACLYKIKDILEHFPLSEIMIIESTCLKVKHLDLYIIETDCKFINNSVILFFKYNDFLFN